MFTGVPDGKPYQPIYQKKENDKIYVLSEFRPMANSRIRSYRIMNINEVNDAFVRGDLLNKLIFYIIGKSNSWSTF